MFDFCEGSILTHVLVQSSYSYPILEIGIISLCIKYAIRKNYAVHNS